VLGEVLNESLCTSQKGVSRLTYWLPSQPGLKLLRDHRHGRIEKSGVGKAEWRSPQVKKMMSFSKNTASEVWDQKVR
jgi:hypothetical protein